jgi:CubicO group peptidase (beta-lactamase class C family)
MNIQTRSRFLFLVNIGLVFMLLAGFAAPVATPVQEVKATDTWDDFKGELESLRQEMKIPGVSSAVFEDGRLAWARGFGFADVENGVPATPETPYHLASVTKTFASVIVMQLVQEDKLSLDDPVSRYGVTLPEGD